MRERTGLLAGSKIGDDMKKRITVLRARHDKDVSTIPDSVCHAVVTGGARSVVGYWRDATSGALDLDVRLLPWVDIDLTFPSSQRLTQLSRALAAVRATKPAVDPMSETDGVIVLTLPGRWPAADGTPNAWDNADGGAAWIEGKPAAALPIMASDHTFMCHEVGHVLAFSHTWGVENSGVDWGGTGVTSAEYGSPHDLMSSAAFGTKSVLSGPPNWWADPTFDLPAFVGWPHPTVERAGPLLSRANLWLGLPEAVAGRMATRTLDTDPTSTVRLHEAGGGQSPTLLLLTPTAGAPGNDPQPAAGQVCVELRVARGWDQGLDSAGASLSQVGLVIHTLKDVPTKGLRSWYEGVIPVSSTDNDLVVNNGQLTITLGDHDVEGPAGPWADVTFAVTGSPVTVWFAGWSREDVFGGQSLEVRTTPCRDQVEWGAWETRTTRLFDVRTTGFPTDAPGESPPTITWTVGGTTLAGANGVVTIGTGLSAAQLDWSVAPATSDLRLESRQGQAVLVDVTATATAGALTASATTTFTARGRFHGYRPDDQAKVNSCLLGVTRKLPIPWPKLSVPDPAKLVPEHLRLWLHSSYDRLDRLVEVGFDSALVNEARRIIEIQLPG